MKLDLTQPLRSERWMKEGQNEPIADFLKKYIYGGQGLDRNADEKKHADEMYAYYKLFQKLDNATPETEYTPEELVIIKRVSAQCLVPGAYGQVIDMIDGKK